MAKKKITKASDAGKLKVAPEPAQKKGHSVKEARGAMYGSKE